MRILTLVSLGILMLSICIAVSAMVLVGSYKFLTEKPLPPDTGGLYCTYGSNDIYGGVWCGDRFYYSISPQ